MRLILPGRFEPIQFLRESPTVSTFLAADHAIRRSDVIVRVLRKGCFPKDPARLFASFGWYRGLRHPHIEEFIDAGLTPAKDLFSVRAYLPKTSMFDSRDPESLKLLLGTIDYLHARGIVHGAIKPSNVFGSGTQVKLTDSWLVQKWRKPETEEELRFTAPEVVAGGLRTTAADLYSVGALVYRFHSGRDLFDDPDLDSLARKYSWAAPRPLAAICHASHAVSDIVTELVHKDPARRGPAFAALKEELGFRPMPASQAPSFGTQEVIEQVLHFLKQGAKNKRLVIIEGAAGSGKTRLVEELSRRFAFHIPVHAIDNCPQLGKTPAATLASWIVSLYEERYPAYDEEPSVQRLVLGSSDRDRVFQDVIEVLRVMASRAPGILIFEDVDRTNRGALRFLDTAGHMSDLPMPLVITTRPMGLPQHLVKALERSFGAGLLRVNVPWPNEQDIDTLASFLYLDEDNRKTALEKAGGNPLFLSEYCNAPDSVTPLRVRRTLTGTISKLPCRVRETAQMLSVFEQPLSVQSLQQITGVPESDLEQDLDHLQRIGLADSRVTVRYAEARSLLYNGLAKAQRRELHARSYDHFKNTTHSKAELARHAHRGGFSEAAIPLYLELASDALATRNFRTAVQFYELAEQCSTEGGIETLPIEARVRLARCYAYVGNRVSAKHLLRDISSQTGVRKDPELASAIAAAMASPLVETSKERCVDLLQDAVAQLPARSPVFARRSRALSAALLVQGNISEAKRVLQHAWSCCSGDNDRRLLDDLLGFVQMNQGDFRVAERSFATAEFQNDSRTTALTNRALCIEQLGDLEEALSLQREALVCARSEGLVLGEIAALASQAAIETKLGRMRSAEKLMSDAVRRLDGVRDKSGIPNLLGNLFADAALHWALRGNYSEALQCFRTQVLSGSSGSSPLESFFISTTRCEVLMALGLHRRAASILRHLERTHPGGEFFAIEILLIRSRLGSSSEALVRELRQSVQASKRMELKYQECKVSLALGSALENLDRKQEAREVTLQGLDLARKQGYGPLTADLLLLLGVVSSEPHEKESSFTSCLIEAARMDLTPLLSTVYFQMGSWKYEQGDYESASDYLSKSVSMILQMADALPNKSNYLSLPRHKRTLDLFRKSSLAAQQGRISSPRPTDREQFLFTNLYRLTESLRTATSCETVVEFLLSSLILCTSGDPAVVVDLRRQLLVQARNSPVPDTFRDRATNAFRRSPSKPLFFGLHIHESSGVAIWMPIPCLSVRAGIYLEYPDERASTLDERTIEFITMTAAIAGTQIDRQNAIPEEPLDFDGISPEIIGRSPQMQQVREQVSIAAGTSATVLIEGESGTGKELIAKAIHQKSNRKTAKFVPVDCGAVPETLIETELFGAKRGAYSGSVVDHVGLFEAADQGTLFLDEISNASPSLQTKLLRALQEREIRRVGETAPRSVDVRVIAATNRSLQAMLQTSEFRQDLYFRLKVLYIRVPPLRERPSDIPLLAISFLNKLNVSQGSRRFFGSGFVETISSYGFPGNVRELQNVVERAFHGARGSEIKPVPFDHVHRFSGNEIDGWFQELLAGNTTFNSIRDRFRRRDISRDQLVALVDRGLRLTSGSYAALASRFRVSYKSFMDFLRRNDCLLNFRPYRDSRPEE